MICQREFTIEIISCIGLGATAAWTYNPGLNPNQPPAEVLLTYDIEGYYGVWTAVRTGGPTSVCVAEWRVDWTSAAGKLLRVTSTIVGPVTRAGVAANVICRSTANGTLVSSTQNCPINTTTQVNLTAVATKLLTGGAAYIDINHQIPSDQSFSLSGEVIVECVDP